MGHYLSDMLPDATVICLNCMEGVWEAKTVIAWNGYLTTCICDNKDHCDVENVEVVHGDSGIKWIRHE